MKRVQNSLNYDPADWPGEKNTMPSMTIPDQAMSIQEILRRFAQGLPLGGQKVPLYDEELPFDTQQFQKMDLADKAEIMEANKRRVQDLQSELHDQQKDALRSKQSALLPVTIKKTNRMPPSPNILKKPGGVGRVAPRRSKSNRNP